jgi:putative ABC transport system substrate-binding protein
MKITASILIAAPVVLVAVGLLRISPSEAQQAARHVKLGVICSGMCPFGGPEGSARPLFDALERVGLVRGRTLVLDIGSVVTSEEQIAGEAQKLVSRHPDLILVWTGSVTAARAAKDATRSIPIVLMAVPDVVDNGLVDSLGRPGGNISGTSIPTYDLTIKQLEVLKEINPRLKSVVVVQGDLDRGDRRMVDRLRRAAGSLKLDAGISVTDARNLEQALSATPAGATAVLIVGSMPNPVHRRVRELVLERKLPLVIPWRAWQGGATSTLIMYGPRFPALAERTAALIDRIVRGARPGDLPVEEPTSYELIIDGVMAKALGLTIPPSVRARADDVLD